MDTKVKAIKIEYDTEKKAYKTIILPRSIYNTYENIRNELSKRYDLDIATDTRVHVQPKNGNITNQNCVDIIDTVLNLIDDPLVEKIS